MIIIGSRAFLAPNNENQEEDALRLLKADYDVIMSWEDFTSWHQTYHTSIVLMYPTDKNKYKVKVQKNGQDTKQYEIEIAAQGTSAHFLLTNENEATTGVIKGYFGEVYRTLSPMYLKLTKKSHIIYPIHFEKTMNDYNRLKALTDGIQEDEIMKEYFTLRSNEAKERNKQSVPKLNITNEEFFSSKLAVEQYFVHDDIHEMVKHHDIPVYEMMKRDYSLAKCEEDMFHQLPFDYRIQAVQEEAYTIALERYIVPQAYDFSNDYYICYKRAVMRICTNLCSGWFRAFAIEHYQEVINRYNPNFVENFKQKVRNGEIVPIKERRVEEVPVMNQ